MTKAQVLRSIRQFCVDCVCGDLDWVRDCPSVNCNLHPFRMGTDPKPSKAKQEQGRKLGVAMRKTPSNP